MSLEDNKKLVRRAFESMSEGPEQFLKEHSQIYGPDLVAHFPGMPPVTTELHKKFGLATFEAFPNLKRPVDEVFGEGDLVVCRWRSLGNHNGPFQGIPPTGKYVTTSGTTVFRIADGKIVEEWIQSDMLGLLAQLGAFPGPGKQEGS